MSAADDWLTLDVERILAEAGVPAELRLLAAPAAAAGRPWADAVPGPADRVVTVPALPRPASDRWSDPRRPEAEREQRAGVLIAAAPLPRAPQPGDRITLDAVIWTVTRVETWRMGARDRVHRLEVQR